jgi:hypothetical protein
MAQEPLEHQTPPQFTVRALLGLMTLLAIVLGVLHYMPPEIRLAVLLAAIVLAVGITLTLALILPFIWGNSAFWWFAALLSAAVLLRLCL